jgi:hypothetical protein
MICFQFKPETQREQRRVPSSSVFKSEKTIPICEKSSAGFPCQRQYFQELTAFPEWNVVCCARNYTFGGNLMSAKAGAGLFVVLYILLLVPLVLMAGSFGSMLATAGIIGSAEAIVLAMLYFSIFFGHYDDHEEAVPKSSHV